MKTSIYDETKWKLVPIEPTMDMIVDGFESKPSVFDGDDLLEQMNEMSGCEEAAFIAKRCYLAMLSAAQPYTEDVNCKGFLDSWISSDERLPELNSPFLAPTVPHNGIAAYCRIDAGDGWVFAAYGGFGDLSDFENYDVDDEYIVDRWIPLPKLSNSK